MSESGPLAQIFGRSDQAGHLDSSRSIWMLQFKASTGTVLLCLSLSVLRFGADGCGLLIVSGERPSDSLAICGVRLGAMIDMQFPHGVRYAMHRASGVVEQNLPLCFRHQAEQVARLCEVVFVDAVVPVSGFAFDRQARFIVVGLIEPCASCVGVIRSHAALIAIDSHQAVAVITVVVLRPSWRIHRNLVMIDGKAVALCVAVGKEPSLQHLVGRKADSRHHVGGIERGLLDIGKPVVGIAVEFEIADLDKRIILLRPYLGQIEGIHLVCRCVLLFHHLKEHRPARKFSPFDRFIEIAVMRFAV